MLEMSYCTEKGIPHSVFLEWEPEDRAKTMAFVMEQAGRCVHCGTAGWEWEENKFAYTPIDEFCRGCYMRSKFSDTESRSLPGTNVKLVPTTPHLQAQMVARARKQRRRARAKQE
jgi:hypothetical protein